MMRGYGPRMENYMRSANDMNSSLVEYVSGIQANKAFNRSCIPLMENTQSLSTISRFYKWSGGVNAGFGMQALSRPAFYSFGYIASRRMAFYMEGTLSLPAF